MNFCLVFSQYNYGSPIYEKWFKTYASDEKRNVLLAAHDLYVPTYVRTYVCMYI